jgi:hypothetical protein
MKVSVHHPKPVFVTDLKNQDVLLGRGNGASEHLGNRIFRDRIREMKENYDVFAESRARAAVVTDEMLNKMILEVVKERGGRFLKKAPKCKTNRLLRNCDVCEVEDCSSVMEKTRRACHCYRRRHGHVLGKSDMDPAGMRAGDTASTMEEIVSRRPSSFVREPLEVNKTSRVSRIEDCSSMSQSHPNLPAMGDGSEQIRPSSNCNMLQEDQAAKIRFLWERQHQQHLPPTNSSVVVSSINMEQVLQGLHDVQTLRMAAESSSSTDAPSPLFSYADVGRANGGGDSSLLYAPLLLSSRLTKNNHHQQRSQRLGAPVQPSVVT